jgi:hypothetical protein
VNPELARLLAAAGYERALETDSWRSVIVVNNFGSVPKLPDLPPEFALRGFKLLLLDASGVPTHFARCGTATDQALLREGEILEALSHAPELARSVPHTRSVASSTLRVLVSTYLSGKTYDQFVHRETQQTWMRRALEILEVATTVLDRAAFALPRFLTGPPLIDLRTEVQPRLELLRRAGIDPTVVDTVDRALADVAPVGRQLQHGDLWPGNLIWHDDAWILIDFAEFGYVQVPMYDAFHLLHYNPERWHKGSSYSWINPRGGGARSGRDPWGDACAQLAHTWGHRLGLNDRQLGATLLFYLAYISSYRLRPGVPFQYGEAFLRDLHRVTEALREGVLLEHIVSPS